MLELSSDHRVLVAGSQDGMMAVWIMEDIEVMHTLAGHSGEPFKGGVVPDSSKQRASVWQQCPDLKPEGCTSRI